MLFSLISLRLHSSYTRKGQKILFKSFQYSSRHFPPFSSFKSPLERWTEQPSHHWFKTIACRLIRSRISGNSLSGKKSACVDPWAPIDWRDAAEMSTRGRRGRRDGEDAAARREKPLVFLIPYLSPQWLKIGSCQIYRRTASSRYV